MADSQSYSKILGYIEQNPMAVLSTVSTDGTPYGAVVYVCVLDDQTVGFITKNATRKYVNLVERPTVSITIGNDEKGSTLQLDGRASVVEDAERMAAIIQKITLVHTHMAEWLPPLAKLRAGNYAVVAVKITHARLAEFMGKGIGSTEIFTDYTGG